MKNIFLFLVMILVTQNLFAIQITDPNKVFDHLKNFSPGLPFLQSMQCGQKASYQADTNECQISCNNLYCQSRCMRPPDNTLFRFELTLADCTPEQAFIYGTNGFNAGVTESVYTANANNWILPFLLQIGLFIQPEPDIQISGSHFQFVDYIDNGKKQTLKVEVIYGDLKFPGGSAKMGFEIWLAPDLFGIKQIVYFGLPPGNVFMQLRGLILK